MLLLLAVMGQLDSPRCFSHMPILGAIHLHEAIRKIFDCLGILAGYCIRVAAGRRQTGNLLIYRGIRRFVAAPRDLCGDSTPGGSF